MIADTTEKNLRRQALVDAVQELFDETRARLSGCQLQRTPTLELTLGSAQPMPRALAVSEDMFGKRGNASEAYGSIGFVPTQSLATRTPMRQRASGND